MSQDIDLDAIARIAKEAGKAIMDIYANHDGSSLTKADDSPLTAADLAANKIIEDSLRNLTPHIPILSEESKPVPYEERRQWSQFWMVDPLDGTREFLKRNGQFTVNIALIVNNRAELGVVHVPVTGHTYKGRLGEGAWADHLAGWSPIFARKSGETLKVVTSLSHFGGEITPLLERIGDHESVSMGSSLKLCLVAEGQADCYPRIGPTMEWDTAAAQAIAEAAGAKVFDPHLKPLVYNKPNLLNPFFVVDGQSGLDWESLLEPLR